MNNDLLEEVVMDMTDTVAMEVHQKDVVDRLEELANIQQCVELQVAGRFLQRWKKEYAARLKLKRSMFTFPCNPSMASTADQIDNLIPDRRLASEIDDGFFINQTSKLSLVPIVERADREHAVQNLLKAHEIYKKMCHMKSWQPLDIQKLIGSILKRKHKTKLAGN